MPPKPDSFEDVLQKIIKEVNSRGTPADIHACHKLSAEILGYLQQRTNSYSSEIDVDFLNKVFRLLRVVFHVEQKKLHLLGIELMQKLLEDDRFVPKNLTGESRQAFPEMFVNALAELCLEGSDDTVVEILRVSLQLACQPLWMQEPYALMKIIMFCMQVCGLRRSANVKTAAAATNVQAVTSFCAAVLHDDIAPDAVLPGDFQTVLTFFGDNLENLQNFSEDPKGIEVLRTTLLSIYTILRHTSRVTQHHPQFQEYMWRKITPALCHWLGKPAEMYMQSVARQMQSAAGLSTPSDMDMIEVKLVAQIFIHLARTYSRTDSMRCVLGSLLHRMASVASVRQRLSTLNSLVEVLDCPQFIVDLDGPNNQGFMPDTCLIAIIAETLAKLAKIKHHEVEMVCTKLSLSFLASLEHIVEGTEMEPDQVAGINNAFARLGDTSPMTVEDLEEQVDRVDVEKRKAAEKAFPSRTIDEESDDLNSNNELPRIDSVDSVGDEPFDSAAAVDEDDVPAVFQPSLNSPGSCRTEKDEMESASRFVTRFVDKLPDMLSKMSTVEADEAMQEFSSSFCEDERKLFNGIPYLNADAVYVAAYQILRFTVSARDRRYYARRSVRIVLPMSEKEFVGGVLGCGLLVYMSAAWACEVYQIVTQNDVLEQAAYIVSENEPPLIQTVRDIEGTGRDHPYLGDCMRLETMAKRALTPEKEAGIKLARYLVGRCWKGLEMSLQSVFLDLFSRTKLLSLRKELTEDVLQLMCSALGGLQRYANLCARLHLFDLCGSAYALLARVCCSSLYPQPALNSPAPNPNLLRLHPWNVLSIDVILRRSLEMGSHNPSCWKAFFTCYLYLNRLETRYLISAKSTSLTKRELEDCSSSVTDIATRFMGTAETKPSESLDADHSYMALGALLNALDQCFVDATQKLNLTNLCNFMRTLGDVSLRVDTERVMLLERLTNMVIASSKCGRPLLHIMIVWATAIPYLYQAATSRTPVVTEKAITYIHSMVAALTSSLHEHPHFHFNELQLKPFESLICTQICSLELQELIVYSLCNLVETTKSDIKSGWRSLFCTLRGIQIDAKSGNLLQAVGDVYEAYLNSDSIRIFSASLWECVQSLLKLYRASLDATTASSLPPAGQSALKYIRHLMRLLFSLLLMNEFPGLAETDKLRTMCPDVQSFDLIFSNAPVIESLEEHLLEQIYLWVPGEETRCELRKRFFSRPASSSHNTEYVHEKLLSWDDSKGVVMAIYNVLDGLICGLLTSWNGLNNNSVESIVEILRSGSQSSRNVEFCLFIVSSSLLPTVQQMIRKKNPRFDGPFQQLIGLLTELIADLYFQHFELIVKLESGERCLASTIHVLAECLSSGHEVTSRLAGSCVRHLIYRICSVRSKAYRLVVVQNLLSILHVTFAPLRELMSCYNSRSKSIYGDSGHVKIAIVNDSSLNEMQKMRQSAYQIFLTDEQRSNDQQNVIDPDNGVTGKSFTFLVYPSELDYHVSSNLFLKRVPLDRLIQGLMLHIQAQNFLQHVLHVHTDSTMLGYLDSYERLMLLCGIRQTHILTEDFNHLSGLKFLIKRVLSSPHAINLYHLEETSSTMHTLELLKICAVQVTALEHLQLGAEEDHTSKLENDILASESARFFSAYSRKWGENLAQDYLLSLHGCGKVLKKFRFRVGVDARKGQTPVTEEEAVQLSSDRSGLVEVSLPEVISMPEPLPTTGTTTSAKAQVSSERLSRLLNFIQNPLDAEAGNPDMHNGVSDCGTQRKNPFRESVTSPSELPSDCAVELQKAMEEDTEVSKKIHDKEATAHFELPGLSTAEKLSVTALSVEFCEHLLDYDRVPEKKFLGVIQQYILWLRQTLKL